MNKNIPFQGKESFQRMNFLYQASHLLTKIPEARDVATSLGHVMVAVSKKSVLRMEPAVKRTLCKGCHGVLVPGVTARVRLRRKPCARLVWTCLRCGTPKSFVAGRDHRLWAERPEAVVQEITCGEPVAPPRREEGEAVKCVTTHLDNLTFHKLSGPSGQSAPPASVADTS
ncbi:ribonuclease P protein subunit p21 [Bacillus rossius redtenbacheri]|uniref:ribonuclease P protein subunit p21 n=1 Tax=Bacillus rossius redtenbacheri TaxID=93214 RepID=UPI002FDD858A